MLCKKSTCKVSIKDEFTTSTDFQSQLPFNITHEIKTIKSQTEKDNREKSLTICKLDNKIFIGNYAKGSKDSTYVMPCDRKKYGKNVIQIGDIHTHPFNDPHTIGLTPSEADFVENINQSFKTGIPQISCIVGAGKKGFINKSNHIHCFQPKTSVIEDGEKVKRYNRAYISAANIGNNVHPFFRENIPHDFFHIWYKDGIAVSSEQESTTDGAKELFGEMVGKSTKRLKEDIPRFERGSFCDLIQSYNLPNNDLIGKICRIELESKDFFGLKY